MRIRIDHSKCTGCRHCEAACVLHHYEAEVNPRKSRIRVYTQGEDMVPVIAGPFTEAECTTKRNVFLDGKEYDQCTLCHASCNLRSWFREPGTDVALKCDFCGDPPDPSCVESCPSGALTMIEQ
jgi:benzoyl-CoA reductase subunit BamC